ncbi:uncharacterized protein DUF4249 [Mucilaginibacter auburnensis]|uniref:Uncharacterized protein DUF4249 n=2 Tax=Mucilaginibacter auburnensis TaxID=1457233 RepID=A0A2H9VVS9_9SPHI|nr:uncharacterized protein DUF4249 [Mucilaginibacter auburnensis]
MLTGFALSGCKERYVQPVKDVNSNFLVVEGLINTGADSTIFNLSYTFKLDGKAIVTPEKTATVSVETENGPVYALPETIKGGKYGANLGLDPAKKYRLRIRTKDNKEYVSQFVESKVSPPFNLNYNFDNNALNFTLDTYDASGKSIYYKYDYEETWEYESQLFSSFKIENGNILPRNLSTENIHTCWRVLPSPNILLTSTANLSESRVTDRPILSIPSKSQKLHIEYSILVKQSVLTAEAFAFWETLRNNTEKVGSIFDAQPSQLFGNIKSTSNADETVIGFVSAGTVTQKRLLFIVSEFPSPWFNVEDKTECLEAVSKITFLRSTGRQFIPLDAGGGTEKLSCADCRLFGGSTQKPSYWK